MEIGDKVELSVFKAKWTGVIIDIGDILVKVNVSTLDKGVAVLRKPFTVEIHKKLVKSI